MITTKHCYSKPIKRSQSEIVKEYINPVWELLHKMVNLRNSCESNHNLSNIRLPRFNKFPKIDNSIIKVATLLQYRTTLGNYGSALVSFGGKDLSINQKPKEFKVIIKNNISRLDDIIQKLTDTKKATTARFNKSEIEKDSKEFFKERSSSMQIKNSYLIIIKFINFLFDFSIFLSNFAFCS